MIGLIAGLALFALRSLIIYFMHGSIKMNLSIPVGTWLNVILFVGLSEEVVFRGYLLQKIESISTFWTANLISAFLFFIMHLPFFFIVRHVGAFELLNVDAQQRVRGAFAAGERNGAGRFGGDQP